VTLTVYPPIVITATAILAAILITLRESVDNRRYGNNNNTRRQPALCAQQSINCVELVAICRSMAASLSQGTRAILRQSKTEIKNIQRVPKSGPQTHGGNIATCL